MCKIPIFSVSALLFSAFFGIWGCGPGKENISSSEHRAPANLTSDQKSDLALKHFIAGSLEESKGNHEQAIAEYALALLFDENPTIYSAIAKNYLLLQNAPLAASHARKAVELAPDDVNYREQLAEIYIATYQPDSAAVHYEEILKHNPSNVQARFILARIYQKDKPLRALELYESIMERIGSDWDVLFHIAEIYSTLGQFDKAVETMESLRKLDPGNEALLQTLGGLYLQMQRIDDALSVYKDLSERFPDRRGYSIFAAGLYKDKGNWTEAERLLERAFQSDSLDTDEAMQVGEIYFQQSLTDSTVIADAFVVFLELKERYPDDWRPCWFLGASYFNERKYKESIPEFERVIKINPNNLQAYDILSRAYLATEEYPAAIKMLQMLVDKKVANAETYSYLGFAYNKLGMEARAIEALETALKIDPNRMDALSALALTYDNNEQYELSDKLYERALRHYENDTLRHDATYYLILNNFAYTLSERGIQLERALEMSQKAVEFESDNSSYLDTIGWIYFKIGKLDLALKYIHKAISIRTDSQEPAGPVLYDHLGDIYFASGNVGEALKYWKESLLQDPSNTKIEEKIRRATE